MQKKISGGAQKRPRECGRDSGLRGVDCVWSLLGGKGILSSTNIRSDSQASAARRCDMQRISAATRIERWWKEKEKGRLLCLCLVIRVGDRGPRKDALRGYCNNLGAAQRSAASEQGNHQQQGQARSAGAASAIVILIDALWLRLWTVPFPLAYSNLTVPPVQCNAALRPDAIPTGPQDYRTLNLSTVQYSPWNPGYGQLGTSSVAQNHWSTLPAGDIGSDSHPPTMPPAMQPQV